VRVAADRSGMALDRSPARVLLCRPGFERECADELAAAAGEVSCTAVAGSGVVVARGTDATAHGTMHRVPLRELVFARDGFDGVAFDLGETRDRIAPLLERARAQAPFADLWMQHADTEEGRSLGRLGTRIEARLRGALGAAGLVRANAGSRLHVLLLGSHSGYLGRSQQDEGALWSMGIPRLRLPGAPSRSAAKLEEALLWFGATHDLQLRAGTSSIDLGAAPGGWSWVLARRGLRVTAIDHGRLAQVALDAGAVLHVAADAFTYRPQRAVDLLVCDVVDKPARVTELIARWFAAGWCHRALFNLKLPMKQRGREAAGLLARLRERVPGARCAARQLYHDREEITVFLARG
jgi:23S rRNA (cytidine2498-2'-O)-methyltransferase